MSGSDNSSVKRIIFPDANDENIDRNARIIWILEDCANIPKPSYFGDVYTKLNLALKNDGFDSGSTYHNVIVDPNADSPEFRQSFESLEQEYKYYGIYLDFGECIGDKGAKLNWVFAGILRWSIILSSIDHTTGNVVLISSNENFGQGTKFSAVRDTLVKKGFNVSLVNPDTLLKLDVSPSCRCSCST